MPSKAYFKDIKAEITNQLNSAIESIYIAVAWFTDDSLFNSLLKKAEAGIEIHLLVSNDDINFHKLGLPFSKLKEKGVNVYSISSDYEIMHHKFCIIDKSTVITGSFNWTKKASVNDENITIIKNNIELADDYIQEFKRLSEKTVNDGAPKMVSLTKIAQGNLIGKTLNQAIEEGLIFDLGDQDGNLFTEIGDVFYVIVNDCHVKVSPSISEMEGEQLKNILGDLFFAQALNYIYLEAPTV